jgi:peptide subunit release factor 1 (eRF1)
VVADAPFLRPLAALLPQIPPALVVFVDGRRARLIPVTPAGPREELALESDVPGHHRRGGWAQLAQSRYQRHILEHRARHFEAVAAALVQLTEGDGLERMVLAGVPRTVTALEKHLPPRILERIVGRIAGARHEPADVLLDRATKLLSRLGGRGEAAAVEAVLTEAAKGRRAVAGLGETLEAVARGAVRCLYLLEGFRGAGSVCVECGALHAVGGERCALCGKEARAAELGEAIVERVIAAGGEVQTIAAHQGLAGVGGVAALLRYPL